MIKTDANEITGSIQTKGNTYYAVLRLPYENGKIKQKWISTKINVDAKTKKQRESNRREAEKFLIKTIEQYSESELTQSEIMFLNRIEDWLSREKSKVRPNTWDSYEACYRLHIKPFFEQRKYKKMTIADISPLILQNYIDHRVKNGSSAETVKRDMRVLQGTFKQALRYNIIPFNPCERIDLPKSEKFRGSAYSAEQAKELLIAIKDDPLEIAVVLALFCGLRKSECLGLRWTDVDFHNNTITICNTIVKSTSGIYEAEQTKTDSSHRVLHLNPTVKEYLLNWKSQLDNAQNVMGNGFTPNEHVCCWLDGRNFEPSFPSHHLARVLRKNNLPKIRFHDLRHTAGSLLINAGLEPKHVQEFLGHSDISTTMNIYVHLNKNAKVTTGDLMNNLLT